jgi:hypothetical protein
VSVAVPSPGSAAETVVPEAVTAIVEVRSTIATGVVVPPLTVETVASSVPQRFVWVTVPISGFV